MTIQDLLRYIESFAPLSLALPWDNCGLLVGNPEREVRKVLISLDVTPNVVNKALATGADLILTHHPLIFKPIKGITDPLLLKLIENRIAVICLHTNLDVARYGVNHALADALGLIVDERLSGESGNEWYHLSVIVPQDRAEQVAEAALAAGAGRVGNYESCSTRHPVSGSFKPLPQADPAYENPGADGITQVEETELEFMVDSCSLGKVESAIRRAHPYETPLLYCFPVRNPNPAYGLGLICHFSKPCSLQETAHKVKAGLSCTQLRLWTAGRSLDETILRIAICGGAGNSMLKTAESKADLLVTGDITYHNYLDSRIPIIDAGHFHTEYPALRYLKRQLDGIGLNTQLLAPDEHEFIQNLIGI